MGEKRDNIRFQKRLQVRFGGEDPAHRAFTENISQSGLFIKTARLYSPSTMLNIELSTDTDNGAVNIIGMVVWAKAVPPPLMHVVNKAGMGIMIMNVMCGEDTYKRLLEPEG